MTISIMMNISLKYFPNILNKILKYDLKVLLNRFIDYIYINSPSFSIKKNKIALFRLDNIGDFILFKGFVPFIKKDKRYRDKEITLIGNEKWRELAHSELINHVDKFIFINIKKYEENTLYRIGTNNKIIKIKALEVINPTHSRTTLTDSLIKMSKSMLNTTCEGDDTNMTGLQYKNKILYTSIINSLPSTDFEFYRNKYFFENWLNTKINLKKPKLKIQKNTNLLNIVICPGASLLEKRWSPKNFSILANMIIKKFSKFKILIIGSKEETRIASIIESSLCEYKQNVVNLSGNTNLLKAVEILSNSRCVITNDTMALHIAAAVNTPVVCIANGNHYGRFIPYPAEMGCKIRCIYPHELFFKNKSIETVKEENKYKSITDINAIKPDDVFKAFIELTNETSADQ